MRKIRCYILAVIFLTVATPALAYVMSSTNYRIERDSINFAGGLSTSTSYKTESTLGESGTGLVTSTSFSLKAGYQQMAASFITLNIPSSAALVPTINGNTGGQANTSTALGVVTNNGDGYTMRLQANTSPALKSSDSSFANYTATGADPDFTWSVASGSSEFGFTPEGNDIVSRYKDNGTTCNQAGGSDTANSCWDPLSTAYTTIAQSVSANYPTGATTTVKFRAEAGSTASKAEGNYSSSVIVTAYTN